MQTLSRPTTDLEILRLKAETNRIEVATYLALSQLEQIEADVKALVEDLKSGSVVSSEEESPQPEES